MAYFSVAGLSLQKEGKELLHSISFEVEKGSLTLIAGKNGSGKSLLLKSIKGLESISAGEIVLDGKPLRRARERMDRIGLVFQDASLEIVGTTLKKDIAFGLENQGRTKAEIESITDKMLRTFSLKDKELLSPSILSGGEKRRLCIAGVLAMDTGLLMLDEPFANLDYPSVKLVLKTLIELKERGVTMIIVSHEAEKFLFHTDNTLILKDGSIAASGHSSDMIPSLRENDIYIPKNTRFEELSWLR